MKQKFLMPKYLQVELNTYHSVLRKLSRYLFAIFLFVMLPNISYGQAVSPNFANNDTDIKWLQTKTKHFTFIFPSTEPALGRKLSFHAEKTYQVFKRRLGTAPEHISIYLKSEKEIVSGIYAQDTNEEYSIWEGKGPLGLHLIPGNDTPEKLLRWQIAYAFQQHVQYFPVDYYYYLFSRPEKSPWSAGFTSFMTVPAKTIFDEVAERDFFGRQGARQFLKPAVVDSIDVMQGRSQIRFFINRFGDHALRRLYSSHDSLLGFIPYFDFNSSFERATGLSYDSFTEQWKQSALSGVLTKGAAPADDPATRQQNNLITDDPNPTYSRPTTAPQYNAFANIRWEAPFVFPYYITFADFGLAAYLSWMEPMRMHEFEYYGTISFADPLDKSFFYSKYTTNRFRPRIELSFNRFPSASGFFGKSRKVKTTNVFALESLWKLPGLSRGTSEWYTGLTLRHLAFDYFPGATFRRHHPDIYFSNSNTRQTDLKGLIAWRNFVAGRHALIHPRDGEGVRFSVTGSGEILGSQTRYTRLNLEAYTIWPAIGDHRIYLYGNGVIDVGESAGRDYLSFSDDGNYQLPGPDFTGSVNPGYDRFVRGYATSLAGARFAFGSVEYRIPLFFDTRKKLLGLIPPARTSFTLFTDAGVMGAARTGMNETSTKYRYSVGAELKRVFSIGGSFELTYEVGLAQPLTQSFGPTPYFNIKTALPF